MQPDRHHPWATSPLGHRKRTLAPVPMTLVLVVVVIASVWLQPVLTIQQVHSPQQQPDEVFTNSFHVRFVRDVDHQEAHKVAKRHGFVNLGPVLGSASEYHFQHRALPHARTRRSISHSRKLKLDPLVSSCISHVDRL